MRNCFEKFKVQVGNHKIGEWVAEAGRECGTAALGCS
jgi:hypothetical protein